jgi:hypothetical protein
MGWDEFTGALGGLFGGDNSARNATAAKGSAIADSLGNGYQYDQGAFQDQNVNYWDQLYKNNISNAQNRGAPQVGLDNPFRNAQMGALDYYQKAAEGKVPSIAEQQMRQGLDQAQRSGMATALSQRGISPGMAARLGGQQAGNMAVQTNQDAATARLAETQAARQALAQLSGMGRGQDINVQQGNQQAQLSQTGLNDAFMNNQMQQGMNYGQQQVQNAMAYQQAQAQQQELARQQQLAWYQSLYGGQNQAAQGSQTNMLGALYKIGGGLVSGLGGMGAGSLMGGGGSVGAGAMGASPVGAGVGA